MQTGAKKIQERQVKKLPGTSLTPIFTSITKKVLAFNDYPHHSEANPLAYQNDKDFLFLPEIHSAKKHLFQESISFIFFFLIVFLAVLIVLSRIFSVSPFIILSAIIAVLYLAIMLFKLFVVYTSARTKLIDFSDKELQAISPEELPIYTVLIPLYKESEVIDQIKKAMTSIDYPSSKLDIIITLEEYDHATIDAIRKAEFPEYFKILILPNVIPKTKPKALNVAFLKTRGEFLVIYDAEIVPEPAQLKKAYLAFKTYPNLHCLQTRLDHYNARQSFITRLFNTEFSFHYDLFLPGLEKMGYPIPLSGHSTHFRKETLIRVGAWDPYNVTEDCDLGIRLHRLGYKTGIINSISYEEATSGMRSWLLQRTRWMKGFIQTSIVHLRHPFRFKEEIGGWRNFFVFLFLVPGNVVINILNLFYWIIFALWLLTHALWIQAFFPLTILYVSAISFFAGNFIFTYLNLYGAYRRKRFDLVKYSLASPVYWIMLALASMRAFYQMLTSPHSWEKTVHGDHLKRGITFKL